MSDLPLLVGTQIYYIDYNDLDMPGCRVAKEGTILELDCVNNPPRYRVNDAGGDIWLEEQKNEIKPKKLRCHDLNKPKLMICQNAKTCQSKYNGGNCGAKTPHLHSKMCTWGCGLNDGITGSTCIIYNPECSCHIENTLDKIQTSFELCPKHGHPEIYIRTSEANDLEWFDHSLHCIHCHGEMKVDHRTTEMYCSKCGERKGIYVKQTRVDFTKEQQEIAFVKEIFSGKYDDMTCGELAKKFPEFNSQQKCQGCQFFVNTGKGFNACAEPSRTIFQIVDDLGMRYLLPPIIHPKKPEVDGCPIKDSPKEASK